MGLYRNQLKERFEVAVDVAEVGGIHDAATVARLRFLLTN